MEHLWSVVWRASGGSIANTASPNSMTWLGCRLKIRDGSGKIFICGDEFSPQQTRKVQRLLIRRELVKVSAITSEAHQLFGTLRRCRKSMHSSSRTLLVGRPRYRAYSAAYCCVVRKEKDAVAFKHKIST